MNSTMSAEAQTCRAGNACCVIFSGRRFVLRAGERVDQADRQGFDLAPHYQGGEVHADSFRIQGVAIVPSKRMRSW
jgi:hypothetical protein